MKIVFEIKCGLVENIGPRVEVFVNNDKLTDTVLDAYNLLEYNVNNTDTQIKIVHKNKTGQDTVVVDNQIVADKWLHVTKIWVDDILLDSNLCVTECSDQDRKYADSLYLNGNLTYKFAGDYFDWYYQYLKQADLEYIRNHPDPEAEHKYLGYDQESSAIPEIHKILESRGYSITS